MYLQCMFCDRPLGENQALEAFPVGRRLAFDVEKGRLWVVCRRCERWNLVPMEERWEAVEACERAFEGTRLRVSSENMGLARHLEGLELVRIGRPLRSEFAAWRYGDQFGRRRKRAFIYGAAGVAAFGIIMVGGVATGLVSGGLMAQSGNFVNLFVNGRTVLKLRTEDGRTLKLKPPEIQKARMLRTGDGWEVSLKKSRRVEVFQGDEAERVAGLLLTKLNHSGGSKATVQQAVSLVEQAGHPERYVEETLALMNGASAGKKQGLIQKLPSERRLALEMSLHEERERRALEGDLKGLEVVWRREEELAAISDDLFLPDSTDETLERLRGEGP